MKTRDKNIWYDLLHGVNDQYLIQTYNKPKLFQAQLAGFIRNIFKKQKNVSAIEFGSSTGVTSALLPKNFKITLLDYNPEAIKKAKRLFRLIKHPASFIQKDFFKINAPLSLFDLTFNAGVLEHFHKKERQLIINKMLSFTKNGGYILIAIPNHFSWPYRLGYLWKRAAGKWIYPVEHKFNLKNDLKKYPHLKLLKETALDKNTIYDFLPKKIQPLFIKMNRLYNFEGYLKIYLFKKS